MRLGFVTPGWPHEAFPNGITKYTDKIVKALAALGEEAWAITSQIKNGDSSHVLRMKVAGSPFARAADAVRWRLNPLSYYEARFRRGLLSAIQDAGLDTIQIPDSFGRSAAVQDRLGMPVTVRLHGPWFLNGPINGVEQDQAYHDRVRREGEAIAAAHGVTSPSQCVIDDTAAFYGIDLPHAKAIPNPCEQVSPEETWTLDACERGLVLFIGRFDRHKGGDIALRAFARVLEQESDARLVFVGPDRGLRLDDGRVQHFEDFTQSELTSPVRERVDYRGALPTDQLNGLRRQANVVIMCSRWENYANTLTEALALGCPIAATNSGGTPEIIQHERNGLLCEPESPESMASTILSVLRDDERARGLGAQAYRDATTRHDPLELARQTLVYHRSLLG